MPRTDQAVRVDDTAAIAALAQLEDEWRALQDLSTERMLAAVQEGRTLIWMGYWAIAALILAALIVGALVYWLIRDLQEELRERLVLQRSQERLATIVEQSPTTIVMTDTQARIQYVNRKFEDLTGWLRDEIIGKTPALLQSGTTSPSVYETLRDRLARKESWHGVFRNTPQGRIQLLGRNHDPAPVGAKRGRPELCRDRRRCHRNPPRP